MKTKKKSKTPRLLLLWGDLGYWEWAEIVRLSVGDWRVYSTAKSE